MPGSRTLLSMSRVTLCQLTLKMHLALSVLAVGKQWLQLDGWRLCGIKMKIWNVSVASVTVLWRTDSIIFLLFWLFSVDRQHYINNLKTLWPRVAVTCKLSFQVGGAVWTWSSADQMLAFIPWPELWRTASLLVRCPCSPENVCNQ